MVNRCSAWPHTAAGTPLLALPGVKVLADLIEVGISHRAKQYVTIFNYICWLLVFSVVLRPEDNKIKLLITR